MLTPMTTPARAVRIDDTLWRRVKTVAARRGETPSDLIRHAIREHLDRTTRAD